MQLSVGLCAVIVAVSVLVVVVEKEEEDAWYWAVPYYRNTLQEVFVRC